MNKKIKSIIEQIQSIEISKRYLKELELLLSQSYERLEEIEKEIKLKDNKIDSLESQSFLSIYFKVIGTYAGQLEITNEVYLNLCLEYNEMHTEIDLLKFQIDILKSKQEELAPLRKSLRSLIKEHSENIGIESLKAHKRLIRQLEIKIRIGQEMSEAIDEGVILNKKFNSALKFLKITTNEVYKVNKDLSELAKHDVAKIEKFQKLILGIKHSMVKFKSEINDVFTQLNLHKDTHRYFVGSFIYQYRKKLARDIIIKRGLSKSLLHLKEQKQLVLEFTKTLRKDLRKIKKEIVKLEEKEMDFINKIKTSKH